MKRQHSEWEKIFANEATDKGLICTMYRQLMQLNIKMKQPNQKMGGRFKSTFLQRRYTDGQEAHEKMLNITKYQRNANQNYNGEKKNYNGVSITSHQSEWSSSKKLQTINAGERVEKREPSCTIGGNKN